MTTRSKKFLRARPQGCFLGYLQVVLACGLGRISAVAFREFITLDGRIAFPQTTQNPDCFRNIRPASTLTEESLRAYRGKFFRHGHVDQLIQCDPFFLGDPARFIEQRRLKRLAIAIRASILSRYRALFQVRPIKAGAMRLYYCVLLLQAQRCRKSSAHKDDIARDVIFQRIARPIQALSLRISRQTIISHGQSARACRIASLFLRSTDPQSYHPNPKGYWTRNRSWPTLSA